MCQPRSGRMKMMVTPSIASRTRSTTAVVAVRRSFRVTPFSRSMPASRAAVSGLGLQEHDPLGAARAVLVLPAALRALPVGPPDPLQMVQLQHDQGDAPEKDLGLAHGASLGAPRARVNG